MARLKPELSYSTVGCSVSVQLWSSWTGLGWHKPNQAVSGQIGLSWNRTFADSQNQGKTNSYTEVAAQQEVKMMGPRGQVLSFLDRVVLSAKFCPRSLTKSFLDQDQKKGPTIWIARSPHKQKHDQRKTFCKERAGEEFLGQDEWKFHHGWSSELPSSCFLTV